MTADRENAYQNYINEITSTGSSRLDNILGHVHGGEEYERHVATQIDMAFQAGWSAAIISAASAAQLAEALKPFADIARAYAADAPEWADRDAVKAIVNIGDLRAAVTALNAYEASE